MINGLKNTRYKSQLAKAVHNPRRECVFPDLGSVRSLTLVVDGSTDRLAISYCDKIKPGVGVTVFCGCQGKRGTDNNPQNLYADDLNWFGTPKEKWFATAQLSASDILINLTDGTNPAIEYICAMSVASFKVSKKPNGKMYDLVIDVAGSEDKKVIDELVRVLKNLKSIH